MGLLLLFALIAGNGITGSWLGVLIDERNRISLARFQLVLWTILILSAFLTAALYNVQKGQPNPIAIAIPQELWLLMGISVTSLVGSPLIRSTKENKTASEDDTLRSSTLLGRRGLAPADYTLKGQIVQKDNPEQASWADMFSGDDVANVAQLDMSKIQMFYFTLILVIVYGAALGNLLLSIPPSPSEGIKAFPVLDASTIALLGISHAAYLSGKAIPRSN
jgi:hypothetical protein